MKLNYPFLTALLLCCFCLTGCSDLGVSDQALLRPPRATGDTAEIQEIISAQAGGNYLLKYPERGDYRSAVTIHSKEKENPFAIALYSTESDSKMNVAVILSDGENWKCLGTFSNSATGVDKLLFEDITGDGKDEILIGWNSYNGAARNITSYTIDENSVREMMIDDTYNEILVDDITGDKTRDIILLSSSNSKVSANVKLLQYSEQEKRPISKFGIDLEPEMISFSSVTLGNIDKNTQGIVIDGEKAGGLLSTQIIYYDKEENSLKEPVVHDNNIGAATNATNRKDVITSRDMDGDGIIEVPVVTQMSAPANFDGGNICSVTAWKQFYKVSNSLETKLNTIINYTDGYYLIIPEKWSGKITAIADPENRVMNIYSWDSENAFLGDKLLSIYRFTKSAWAKIDKTDFIQLDVEVKSAKAVIAAKINHSQKTKDFNISKEELLKSVKSITSSSSGGK